MENRPGNPLSLAYVVILVCLPAFFAAAYARAGELLFFPGMTAIHRSAPLASLKQNEIVPELVVFYTGQHESLRFLAEYSASPDSKEMERLQLGWQTNPAATLWLGRYHNPIGYWSTEFHHGEYLHVSVSHPGIAYEDEGGPFPTHVSGLLFEGATSHGDASVGYALGLGIGPVLMEQLEPLDMLKTRSQGGKLAISMKLAYKPQAEGQDQTGIFAGHTRIPVMDRPVNEVTQSLAGAFFNRETERTRLFGEIYAAVNQLQGAAVSSRGSFASAYLQGEYKIQPVWTIFGRVESSFGAHGDPYLDLLPAFVRSGLMAGSRYEIARNQAVKIELSRNERQNDVRYNQMNIQWSMVFP